MTSCPSIITTPGLIYPLDFLQKDGRTSVLGTQDRSGRSVDEVHRSWSIFVVSFKALVGVGRRT